MAYGDGQPHVLVTIDQVMQIHDALAHARRHLARRDEMNSEIHLAEQRWSPLTKLVADAEDMLTEELQRQCIIGAPYQHAAHTHNEQAV
jgi:hypothetical protein